VLFPGSTAPVIVLLINLGIYSNKRELTLSGGSNVGNCHWRGGNEDPLQP
jgi:hypothetical protein